MGKLSRIVQLMNLLNHRKSVTLKTIREVCRVPERTAYRYLNHISEADIPVYYDKESRGYSLSRQGHFHVGDPTFGESIVTIFALKHLSRYVNSEYRGDVDRLITKLLARQSYPVEEVLQTVERSLGDMTADSNVSRVLSSALIQAAIQCGKKVELTTGDDNNASRRIEMQNPTLLFKKHWQLVENRNMGEKTAPLENIRRVNIV